MRGSCLCGAVKWEATGEVRDPGACHCGQCRKQSGHYWASIEVDDAELSMTGEVRWFAASDFAKRGFCPTCGSFLFWRLNDGTETGVSLGSVDGPTGLKLGKHIFVADKGDYYDITDGVRQEGQENG